MSQVKQNDTVVVHYTGKLKTGQVFDSSLEREPMEFTLGQGQLIPGFENGIIDMTVSEKKSIEIPSDEAYGEAKPELILEIEKTQIPEEIKPEIGVRLMSTSPDGNQMPLLITEVKETTIIVDANHPLAGQDLIFEVELIEIK